MNQELQTRLKEALARIEKVQRQIESQGGYDKSKEKYRLLNEMIKEQIQNENTRHSTSSSR